jgi:phospholipid/cholesterol/gamma-HCH transport system substrate-binding protein
MAAAVRDQWAETIVGAAVLAAAGGFLIYALGYAGGGAVRGGYEVIARFGEAGALASGADVRVAGVKVGAVSRIDLEPKTFLAKATIVLNPDVKLPADSTAKITSDGLLGGSHISVAPGGAAEDLAPGEEFKNTQGAVDLFGLIGQVLRPPSNAAPTSATPAAPAAADPYPG